MNEEWKNISGYEGIYQVSSFGNVRRLSSSKSKLLKPYLKNSKTKYLRVALCKCATPKQFYVHQLVAKAFLKIPTNNNQIQVNHKNMNPQDNRIENLEWVSAKENLSYGNTIESLGKLLYCLQSQQLEDYSI